MKGFALILWGLLLLPDIRVQGFDLLPTFLGYWIITLGLRDLSSLNHYFYSAKKYSIALIIISLPEIYQTQYYNYILLKLIYMVLPILTTILNLVLIYYVCYGIANLSEKMGKRELQRKSLETLRAYFYLNIMIIAVMLFSFFPGIEFLFVLTILGFIVSLISIIILILLVIDVKENILE